MVRVVVAETGEVIGLSFPNTTTVETIQDVIVERTGIAIDSQRLIHGGRELDRTKTLEDLNIHTKEVLQLLPRLAHCCREWQATGSCARGRRCYLKATHTVENSPRYVEHRAKATAGDRTPSPPTVPQDNEVNTPTPPQQPRQAATKYGALGAQRRAQSLYGGLSGRPPMPPQHKPSQANWAGGCLRGVADRRVSPSQQSNSGDFDGLMSDIKSKVDVEWEGDVEGEEAGEISQDTLYEMSLEEDAANEALGVVQPIVPNFDTSPCGVGAVDMLANLPPGFEHNMELPTIKEQLTPPMPAAVPADSDMPAVSLPEHKETPEKSQAGLEFSAGVHLIEEMEKQVAEWEESEQSREAAYKSWVAQQLASRQQRQEHNASPPAPVPVC